MTRSSSNAVVKYADHTMPREGHASVTLNYKEIKWLIQGNERQPASERNPVLDLLLMLTFRRPKNSKSEEYFLRRFLFSLPGMREDKYGNLFLTIGESPKVLWSSHTDSVHHDGGRQDVCITDGYVHLPDGSKSNCLGADDAAGIWIMREMILAQVPGLYVFHFGEESGGIGSSALAKNKPEFFKGIEMAIAFDRRGTSNVITHQGYGRCCSDEFARSLADQLPGYSPDDGGIFTDTANYVDLVGECTNLSVGYYSEHTAAERLNVNHLSRLREYMVSIDVEKLVVKRVPGEVDESDFFGYGGGGGYFNSNRYGAYSSTSNRSSTSSSRGGWAGMLDEDEDDKQLAPGDTPTTFRQLWRNYPVSTERVLLNHGLTIEQIWEEIQTVWHTASDAEKEAAKAQAAENAKAIGFLAGTPAVDNGGTEEDADDESLESVADRMRSAAVH